MNTFIIAYAFLCLGGVIGWCARVAIAREYVEEPCEFNAHWVKR